MNPTFRYVFIAAALATLAGCGNKGPLVLPTPPAASEPIIPPEAPVEAAPAEAAPADTPATEPATDSSTPLPAETPAAATPVPATTDGDGNG